MFFLPPTDDAIKIEYDLWPLITLYPLLFCWISPVSWRLSTESFCELRCFLLVYDLVCICHFLCQYHECMHPHTAVRTCTRTSVYLCVAGDVDFLRLITTFFPSLLACVEVVWAPSGLPHCRSMPDPVIQLSICVIDFFLFFVEFHLSFTFLWSDGRGRVWERKEGLARGQSRDLRACRRGGMERWRSRAAVGLLSVRVLEVGRGAFSAWTMDEQKESHSWSAAFLSLLVSVRSLGRPPPSPPLWFLPPPSFSKAPLVHTLHLPPSCSSSSSTSSCLSLCPPACRLCFPGGPGSAGGAAVICRRFV